MPDGLLIRIVRAGVFLVLLLLAVGDIFLDFLPDSVSLLIIIVSIALLVWVTRDNRKLFHHRKDNP